MSGRFKSLIAVSLAAATSFGTAQAAEYSWKITGITPETSLYHQLFIEKFVDHVEALSGGEVDMQAFGGGVLAPATQLHDAVQTGVVETAITTAVYLVNDDPVNSFFAAHPGGMDGVTQMAWYRTGGAQKLVQDYRREKQGLHSILCGLGPAEVFMHAHRKVKTAEDLKGMKLRAAGAWADIAAKDFGATTTTVPGSEIFTLLERNAIDGAEFSTISDNLLLGFHEAAPWIVVPGMHVRSFAMELIMQADRWDALPETTKAQINAACALTTYESFLEWSKRDLDAVAGLSADEQAQVVRIGDELLSQIEEAGRRWGESKAAEKADAGDPYMQEVVTSYYDFMKSWNDTSQFRGQ